MGKSRTPHSTTQRSKKIRVGVLCAAATAPLAILIILYLVDVPIGQPDFLIYRYSPFVPLRVMRGLVALGLGAVGLLVIHRRFRRSETLGLGAGAVAGFCYLGLVVWSFFGPPIATRQHTFNMLSPSHDGAFMLESRQVTDVSAYVSTTFPERLKLEPEQMRGRRVLSNPPGMTVLCALARDLVATTSGLRTWLVSSFGLGELEDPSQRTEFAAALLVAILMTMAWGVSVLLAWRLCRIWMPPPAALVVAFACVFNPASVCFTPGKDPAQLLFVLAILLCWMLAFTKTRGRYGFAAGGLVAAATMVGLVHVWVFAIVAGATLWHSFGTDRAWRGWLMACAIPAVAGGCVVALISWVVWDWNIVTTAYRVGLRYGQVQLPIITDPFYWTLVGLPMFLLFVGPLFWAQVVAVRGDAGDSTAALGRRLLVTTVVVLVYVYFFANNSETPRLWIPFVPMLLIGMALRRELFRFDHAGHRTICVLLLALQLGVTVAHWSLMDVRESEWRLSTGRMWE